MIIENAIPSIRAKWPIRKPGTPIYVQQDNAPVHVPTDDENVRNSGQAYGWDMRMKCQPPTSPDYNVFELGF